MEKERRFDSRKEMQKRKRLVWVLVLLYTGSTTMARPWEKLGMKSTWDSVPFVEKNKKVPSNFFDLESEDESESPLY
jgi:hypothetical protein